MSSFDFSEGYGEDVFASPADLVLLEGDYGDEIGMTPWRAQILRERANRVRPQRRARIQQRLARHGYPQQAPAPRAVPGIAPRPKVRVVSGMLGMGSTSVAASSTGTLDAIAQHPVWLQRLILDGDTSDFVLSDIKIGAKSIFSGTEAFPAGAFKPDATGAPFSLKKRMLVGQTVTVSVTNTNTGATKTLNGGFKTVEEG